MESFNKPFMNIYNVHMRDLAVDQFALTVEIFIFSKGVDSHHYGRVQILFVVLKIIDPMMTRLISVLTKK